MARLQRGRITRGQLRTLGFSDSVVTRMARRGELYREHRGVFAVGHVAAPPFAREAAALLACPERTVLSHRSRGAVADLNPPPPTVEVTIIGGDARPRGITIHRCLHLAPVDLTVFEGMPVTALGRTLVDLAGVLDLRPLERALDSALTSRRVTIGEVLAALDRAGAPCGAGSLRRLLDPERPTTRTRSESEERFLALVRAAGLPAPAINVPFDRWEIDFFWSAHRLAVEIDSHRYHGGREAYARDRRKGLALAAAGIDLLRLTWEQIEDDVPAVVGTVAFRLGRVTCERC